jgi:L-alanine-DL-glutamate epimerase-like enolase superfamily enzyme
MFVEPLQTRDGYLAAPDAPGLGLELSGDAYERFRIDPPVAVGAA